MNTKRRLRLSFRTLNDEDFLVLTQTVERAMTGNPNFVTPNPSLASFLVSIIDYAEKLAISNKRGSPEDTQIKNEARRALEKATKALAFYVNAVAEGNLRMLLSSGFILAKASVRLFPPKIVKALELRDGRQRRQMVLSFEAQKNVILYRYRYTDKLDALMNPIWEGEIYETTSSRNNLIAPVIPGTIYYASVQAVNSAGTSDWNDPISWMAR